MLDWHIVLLAVHLASAIFINTNLRVPFAAIVPNQIRIYKEYAVQQKFANIDQSQGINEEEQKILVNCTIRSTNATNKETSKIIKTATANCTVTQQDGVPLENESEQTKGAISDVVDNSALLHDDNFETHGNITDVSNVTIKGQPVTLNTITMISTSSNESTVLIPAIIDAVTSDSQAMSGTGERNLKVAVENFDPTIVPTTVVDLVQQNNDVEPLNGTAKNAPNESVLLFRHGNSEFTLTQPVNGSIQQISNATLHKCSNEATSHSPHVGEKEQITYSVSDDPVKIKLSNDTRQVDPVFKTESGDIEVFRVTTENILEQFNQLDRVNYSFDNSGHLIEMQIPITVDYEANSSEKTVQKQPENTTIPADRKQIKEQLLEQFSSKTVNTSAFTLVKQKEDQNSKSAIKIAFEQLPQTFTTNAPGKSQKRHFHSASNVEDRSGFRQTIGISQVNSSNRFGHWRRAGHLKCPRINVANGPISRTGNDYPLGNRLQNKLEENLSQQLQSQKISKYFSGDAEPTINQHLGQNIPNIYNFKHRQKHPYVNPQSPEYVQLNQPRRISTLHTANVPHRKTIWETLKVATDKAHNSIYYTSTN